MQVLCMGARKARAGRGMARARTEIIRALKGHLLTSSLVNVDCVAGRVFGDCWEGGEFMQQLPEGGAK